MKFPFEKDDSVGRVFYLQCNVGKWRILKRHLYAICAFLVFIDFLAYLFSFTCIQLKFMSDMSVRVGSQQLHVPLREWVSEWCTECWRCHGVIYEMNEIKASSFRQNNFEDIKQRRSEELMMINIIMSTSDSVFSTLTGADVSVTVSSSLVPHSDIP
jgi:cytochrome c553